MWRQIFINRTYIPLQKKNNEHQKFQKKVYHQIQTKVEEPKISHL